MIEALFLIILGLGAIALASALVSVLGAVCLMIAEMFSTLDKR